MGLPNHGTYTSDDGVQTIVISSSDSSNGAITGTYQSNYSPEGVLNEPMRGDFLWVADQSGTSGNAPFLIRFWSSKRPDGRSYSINDSWGGGYQLDGAMRLTGSRAYVNSDGVIESISLGTKTFSM